MKIIKSQVNEAAIPGLPWYLLMLCILLLSRTGFAMEELGDEALSEVSGQALMQMGKVEENGFTFYKAGLDAEIELNLNIEKLQLGCGGVNGAGCDIDIDHLSLSGDCASRPECAASLVRPFFEFAIKNDGSRTLREISGIRLSSEQAFGMLTAGLENSATPNGINTLSGYMTAQSGEGNCQTYAGCVNGYARTVPAYYDAAAYPLNARLQALGLGGAAEVTFSTTSGGFWLPAVDEPDITDNLYFEAPALVVNGSRISSVSLNDGNPVDIYYPRLQLIENFTPATGDYTPGAPNPLQTQGGPLNAVVTSCDWLACFVAWTGRNFSNVRMFGLADGITIKTTFDQDLGYIHKIDIGGSPFSLGFQKEAVKWPGSAPEDVAQRGWWMSFPEPVTIGYVNPQDAIDLASAEIGPDFFPQLQGAINDFLALNPAQTNDLAGIISGSGLSVNAGNLDLSAYPLFLGLSNLQLEGQAFSPNCFGTATFC